jgi:hypothetical protein
MGGCVSQIIFIFCVLKKTGEGEVATVVKDCFQRLLANHYIERCPVPEPSLCPNIAVEPAKKTACGAEVSDLAPGCGPNREWASCPDSNLDATSVCGRYQTCLS